MISHETFHIFEQPWPLLTLGNFNKYPNEHASHVLSVDVISRNVNSSGHLVTYRLLQMKQPVPSIFRKLGIPFPEVSYFMERSVLNPKTQQYEATSYSLSMRSFFRAEELCRYNADPQTGGTVFIQKANFTAFSYFSRIIEEIAVDRFKANAARGRLGLESVLQKMMNEAMELESRIELGVKEIETKLGNSVKDIETKFGDSVKDIEIKFGNSVKELEQSSTDLINAVDSKHRKHWNSLFDTSFTKQFNPFNW